MTNQKSPEEMSKEICQRCGEKDEDRRTLWMACFYAMEEFGLPFIQLAIKGKSLKYKGKDQIETFPEITIPIWSDPIEKEDNIYAFYTLRVCKDCRADWLNAIKSWFDIKPKRESIG